jgi:hypothetical protein
LAAEDPAARREQRAALREHARRAIEQGDRRRALALPRRVAAGELEGADLADRDAQALVATAAEQPTASDEQRRMAYGRAQQARRTVLELLTLEALDREDLLEIDAAVHTRLDELSRQAQHERARTQALAASTHRLGTGTIEAKLISNGRSAKRFGPYLYARYREGGRDRSATNAGLRHAR